MPLILFLIVVILIAQIGFLLLAGLVALGGLLALRRLRR